MNALQRLRDMANRDWIYRDAHYLVADVELDVARAKRFVPWPLRVRDRAQLFLAFFPHNSFGSVYREAGVFFDVSHLGKRAIYSPWMLVDDDVALILGRELLGYPKKLGELAWSLDGDRIRASVARRGHELLSMDGTLGRAIDAPPPMLGRPHRNVSTGVVPAVIAFTPRERAVEVREARLDVRIGSSERDPLGEMGFGRVLAARLHRVDIAGGGFPLPLGFVSPLAYARSILLRSH
jgi:acetoacetate decarboxylase